MLAKINFLSHGYMYYNRTFKEVLSGIQKRSTLHMQNILNGSMLDTVCGDKSCHFI